MASPLTIPVVAERWPTTLAPLTCEFAPSRNDFLQVSPSSRQETVIRRGRRLWKAKLTWTRDCTDMAQLRLWLEALEGHQGSVILWDFGCPFPKNADARIDVGPQIAIQKALTWINGAAEYRWPSGGSIMNWSAPGYTSASGAIAAGVYYVPITGLPAGINTLLRAGEYIQLNRRLYLLADDMHSAADGTATAHLMSPTLEPLTNGHPVVISQAGCEMRLEESDWTKSRTAGDPFNTVSATFIETVKNVAPGGAQFAA